MKNKTEFKKTNNNGTNNDCKPQQSSFAPFHILNPKVLSPNFSKTHSKTSKLWRPAKESTNLNTEMRKKVTNKDLKFIVSATKKQTIVMNQVSQQSFSSEESDDAKRRANFTLNLHPQRANNIVQF